MGTPKREPQEYSRNTIEHKDPGRYIPIIFLLYSWGSLFGVPVSPFIHSGSWNRRYFGFKAGAWGLELRV